MITRTDATFACIITLTCGLLMGFALLLIMMKEEIGTQITISCMEQNAHIRYIEDSIVLDSTGAVSCFISKK